MWVLLRKRNDYKPTQPIPGFFFPLLRPFRRIREEETTVSRAFRALSAAVPPLEGVTRLFRENLLLEAMMKRMAPPGSPTPDPRFEGREGTYHVKSGLVEGLEGPINRRAQTRDFSSMSDSNEDLIWFSNFGIACLSKSHSACSKIKSNQNRNRMLMEISSSLSRFLHFLALGED